MRVSPSFIRSQGYNLQDYAATHSGQTSPPFSKAASMLVWFAIYPRSEGGRMLTAHWQEDDITTEVTAHLGPRGGLSSPASQPTASVFMGSTDIETCSVRSQVEHSNVRTSKPRSPGAIRASAIRCLHAGHIGRSFISLRMTPAQQASYPSSAGCLQASRPSARFFKHKQSAEQPRCGAVESMGCDHCAACVAPPHALKSPRRRGCARDGLPHSKARADSKGSRPAWKDKLEEASENPRRTGVAGQS